MFMLTTLHFSQRTFLHTSAFETVDCLASVDVLVGSYSSMSEAAGAMSTNVKVMVYEGQEEQDRITLDFREVAMRAERTPGIGTEKQAELDTAVAKWRHCSSEARGLIGESGVGASARSFYHTVDSPA